MNQRISYEDILRQEVSVFPGLYEKLPLAKVENPLGIVQTKLREALVAASQLELSDPWDMTIFKTIEEAVFTVEDIAIQKEVTDLD